MGFVRRSSSGKFFNFTGRPIQPLRICDARHCMQVYEGWQLGIARQNARMRGGAAWRGRGRHRTVVPRHGNNLFVGKLPILLLPLVLSLLPFVQKIESTPFPVPPLGRVFCAAATPKYTARFDK